MTQPGLLEQEPDALSILQGTITDADRAAVRADVGPDAKPIAAFTVPAVDIDAIARELAPTTGLTRANDSPFENAMALRLEFRCFGTARKGIMGEITTGADKGLLRLGQSIVVSDALDAIHSADGEIRRWIENRSVQAPLFRAGTRLVKFSLFEEVENRIAAYVTAERPRLVDAFIADWPRACNDARNRLGPQYQAKNYPEAADVRKCFDARRNWLEIGAPKALERLDAEAYKRQAAQLQEAFGESMMQARAAVRANLRELMAKLAERLTPTADGKRKVFRDTAIENVREAFQLFDGCDLTNDDATRAIVQRGMRLLAGVAPDDLRDETADQMRATLARDFERLTTELESLIVTAPSRAYGEDY